MRIKREILLIIAIIFVAMIGGVSAADDNQTSDVVSVADDSPTVDTKTNDTVDVTTVEDESSIAEEDSVIEEGTIAETKDDMSSVLAASSNDDVLGVPADQEVLGATLKSLQTQIDNTWTGGTLTLYQNYVVGTNTADYGRITINKNIIIDGNGYTVDANGRGNIFYVNGAYTITIRNLIIANAGTGQNDGGAFYITRGATMTFSNCQFINNIHNGNGGVIDAERGGTYTFSNCQFINNYASGDGGVLYTPYSGTYSFTDCIFDGNVASTGAVFYSTDYYANSFTMTRCNVYNSAASSQAALYLVSNNIRITDCNFENNTGYSDGGAIHVRSTRDTVYITNTNLPWESKSQTHISVGSFFSFRVLFNPDKGFKFEKLYAKSFPEQTGCLSWNRASNTIHIGLDGGKIVFYKLNPDSNFNHIRIVLLVSCMMKAQGIYIRYLWIKNFI